MLRNIAYVVYLRHFYYLRFESLFWLRSQFQNKSAYERGDHPDQELASENIVRHIIVNAFLGVHGDQIGKPNESSDP